MTAAGTRLISAYLVDTLEDDGVARSSVTRGEGLELLDRFCAAAEGFRSGRFGDDMEASLSFSRDPESDFIEFSMMGPDRFDGRHFFFHAWKLFGLIPMGHGENRHLLFERRDEAAEFVEAYFSAPDPSKVGAWMLGRGATRHREDL